MAINDYIRTSSIDVDSPLNVRRALQRRRYNDLLLGVARKQDVGQTVRAGESPLASPPSWVQSHARLSHAFVLQPLSASRHEQDSMNARLSGSFPLESSPVPASSSVFYEKESRFVRLIYKLSASAGTAPGDLADASPFGGEISGGENRAQFVASSGAFCNRSQFNAQNSSFTIDVPEYGKIRDIRVWVELIHDVRRGTGSIGPLPWNGVSHAAYTRQGLGNLHVALRSPNVSFHSAHPLWNSPEMKIAEIRSFSFLSGGLNQFSDGRFRRVPELLRSSYLLWRGWRLDQDSLAMNTGDSFHADNGIVVGFNVNWDTDIDIRTIFTDSSREMCPHHQEISYPNATDETAGGATYVFPNANTFVGGTAPMSASAPNVFARNLFTRLGLVASLPYATGSVRGNNVPWFADSRIPMGCFGGSNTLLGAIFAAALTSSSPPRGWLTGPGGTAAANEWPTTGSNIGPETMRPVYPLLDDVYAKHVLRRPRSFDESSSPNMTEFTRARVGTVGFRPGLRGTEIHGKWTLMIGLGADWDDPFGDGWRMNERAGVWFRQFRLEFIVDQGEAPKSSMPSKPRRFERSSHVPRRPGLYRRHVMEGAANIDFGVNLIFTPVHEEYGRSVGITDSTGSNLNDFAVFSRITGSLLSSLSADARNNVSRTFLENEFGTPYIPITSGSSENPTFFAFDPEDSAATRALVRDVLRPRPTIGSAQSLRATLSRTRFVRSSRDQVISRLLSIEELGSASGSATPV